MGIRPGIAGQSELCDGELGNVDRQASVLTPSMFMAQLPQIPSRQDRLNVNVGSTSFLILINASSIMGPVLFKSNVYVCIRGFEVGSSGFHR